MARKNNLTTKLLVDDDIKEALLEQLEAMKQGVLEPDTDDLGYIRRVLKQDCKELLQIIGA